MNDPGKPKQARSIETREKIIETGLKMFGEIGYHATSSKKIAKAAGVATGTFYNHFKDKKSLLLELHRRHMDETHENLARFFMQTPLWNAESLDGFTLLRQMLDIVYKSHEFAPSLQQEIDALSHTDPDFAELNRVADAEASEKLNHILSSHRDAMRIEDMDAAYFVISHTIQPVIHAMLVSKPPMEKSRILDALADMFSRFLFE